MSKTKHDIAQKNYLTTLKPVPIKETQPKNQGSAAGTAIYDEALLYDIGIKKDTKKALEFYMLAVKHSLADSNDPSSSASASATEVKPIKNPYSLSIIPNTEVIASVAKPGK